MPKREMPIAKRRWAGVTSSRSPAVAVAPTELPSSTEPKMAAGWAMMMTPTRAIRAAINCLLVKDWARKTWQAHAVVSGIRKRKTVASARGR